MFGLSLYRNAPSSEDYNPPSSPSLASSDEDMDNTADSATAAQELISSFTDGYILPYGATCVAIPINLGLTNGLEYPAKN